MSVSKNWLKVIKGYVMITDKTLLEKLKEQHDIVKNNPFRTNYDVKYYNGFKKQMYKLIELMGDVAYKDGGCETNETIKKGISICIHDWNARIWTCGSVLESGNMDKFYYYYEFLELSLQMIHRYIDTGEFPSTIHQRGHEEYVKQPDEGRVYFQKVNNVGEWMVSYPKEILIRKRDMVAKYDQDVFNHILTYYNDMIDNYDKYWGKNE